MEQDIHFIYFQGFCEAGVSNAHLRWIAEVDGWWFTGHWDITNTSEERGMSRAKCGESRGNQGNRLQRWMAISNNIQSWITCSIIAGEIWNFVIFWFWIFGLGGCYLWHLVGFVLRLWVRQENCYLGTFYNLWAQHSHWRSRSEVSGAERAWDSCDRDEILRTQQQPSSQNMAQPPCKYFIQPLENWNIGSVRDASVSVYLCNSYQLSEDHHHRCVDPRAPPCLTCLQLSSAQGRNVTDSWYISSLKSVFARSWSVSKQTSLIPQIL